MLDPTAAATPSADDFAPEASAERETPLDSAEMQDRPDQNDLEKSSLQATQRLEAYLNTPIGQQRNNSMIFMGRNFAQRETSIFEIADRLKDSSKLEVREGGVDNNNWFELTEQLHWLLVEESLALMADIRDDLRDFSRRVDEWNKSVRQGKIDRAQLDQMKPLAHELHAFASTFALFLAQTEHGVGLYAALEQELRVNPSAAKMQNETPQSLSLTYERGMRLLLDEYLKESGDAFDSQQQISQLESTYARLVDQVQAEADVFLKLETQIEELQQQLASIEAAPAPVTQTATASSLPGSGEQQTAESAATPATDQAAQPDNLVTRVSNLASLFLSPVTVTETKVGAGIGEENPANTTTSTPAPDAMLPTPDATNTTTYADATQIPDPDAAIPVLIRQEEKTDSTV